MSNDQSRLRSAPWQSTGFCGLEKLAVKNKRSLRPMLTSLFWCDVFGDPFARLDIRSRFSGFDGYVTGLARMIDTGYDDTDAERAIRNTYQFAHFLATALIGKPTDVHDVLPATTGGYLDCRQALLGRAYKYYQSAPTMEVLTRSYEGALDPSGRQEEVVHITAGMVYERIERIETDRATRQADYVLRKLADHPDLLGF